MRSTSRVEIGVLRWCSMWGVVLLFALGLASTASAAVLFVDPAGDDTNNCLTPGTACETIQEGVNRAEDGDVVSVAPGTYEEVVFVDFRSDLRIEGSGRGQSFITDPSPSGAGVVSIDSSRNIVLQGFTISGRSPADTALGVHISASYNVTIRDCIVEKARSGFFIRGMASAVHIENSIIRDNTVGLSVIGGASLQLDDAPSGPSIIEGNSSVGVFTKPGSHLSIFGATRISGSFIGIFAGGTVTTCCSHRPPREILNNVFGIFSRGGNLLLEGPGRIEGGTWGVLTRGGFVRLTNGFDISDNTFGIGNRGGHLEIGNIEISNNAASGISIQDSASVTLTGTTILNNGEDGLQLSTLSTANFENAPLVQGNAGVDVNCPDRSSVIRGDLSGVASSTCTVPGLTGRPPPR